MRASRPKSIKRNENETKHAQASNYTDSMFLWPMMDHAMDVVP